MALGTGDHGDTGPGSLGTLGSSTAASRARGCGSGAENGGLEAKKADFHPDQSTISISGVKVEFFGPGEDLRVRADEGLFHTKTRVLTLKGQVEMQRGDLIIKTSEVTYLPAKRVLVAPDNVVIQEPRLKVEGKELRVDLAAKKLIMAQHHLTEVMVQDWQVKP